MGGKKYVAGGVGTGVGYMYLYNATDVASKYLLKPCPDGSTFEKIVWGITNAPAYVGIVVGGLGCLWAAKEVISHYARKRKEGG